MRRSVEFAPEAPRVLLTFVMRRRTTLLTSFRIARWTLTGGGRALDIADASDLPVTRARDLDVGP